MLYSVSSASGLIVFGIRPWDAFYYLVLEALVKLLRVSNLGLLIVIFSRIAIIGLSRV